MKRVKITYLIGSLATGGAERQLIELLKRLDRTRWQPSLVLFDELDIERARELADDVFSLGVSRGSNSRGKFRGVRAAKAIMRLSVYLRNQKPAILHAILPASLVFASPAAKLARVPILIGSRRSLIDCYRTDRMVSMFDHIATRMCDFNVGNSAAVTRELIEVDSVPPESALTIYNGVDTDRFHPGERTFRRVQGWTEKNVVFGIVANFIPYKRHQDFVAAAAIIAKACPEARFLLVGEDRGTLPAIREQITRFGLSSSFAIIPGSKSPETLCPSMDIYLCTSETEGLSNVILEAAACGLPIVATNVGGNSEIVDDHKTGFIVPLRDPAAIAEAAVKLATDKDLRAQMGTCSLLRIIERFSMERMVDSYQSLYEQLMQRRAPSLRTLATAPQGVGTRR